MTVTVSPINHIEISDCDSESNWSGNGMDSDNILKKEGIQSLIFVLKSSGNNDIIYNPPAPIDMSGIKHLRIWFLSTVAAQLNTIENGGIQFWISDGSNTGYYYVSGSNVYQGGWTNLVIDLSRNVDNGTKPSSMNAITTCGIRTNMTSTGKNALNTWIDYFHIADSLEFYGDDGGGYFDMDDIKAAEDIGGWGILKKEGGVFFLTGGLINGDVSGSSASKFQPKSSIVIFENRKVNISLYKFNAVDNGIGTTEHLLGVDGGEGLVISVESLIQTPKYDLNFSDINLTDVMLEGCKFADADETFLPTTGVNKEVINCVFESCGTLNVNTCKVENCVIINANSIGCKITSESHEFSNNTIKGSDYGIEFSIPGTYSLSNIIFDNIITAHIHNTSGGLVTINCSGTTNAVTSTGNTTINNVKALTLTGLISGTEIRAYIGTDPDISVEIDGIESSGTSFIINHESGGIAGYVIIHKVDYEAITMWITYPSTDASIPIQQVFDRNYENP